jgi:hypothetical protein
VGLASSAWLHHVLVQVQMGTPARIPHRVNNTLCVPQTPANLSSAAATPPVGLLLGLTLGT